jgi:hypothetical protein
MDRNDEQQVIDMGAASAETKGPSGRMIDFTLGQEPAGLSDD